MKRKITLTILSVIILAIFLFILYQKSTYALDEISAKINSVRLPNNVLIKEYEYSNEYTYYKTKYIKDNIQNIYSKRESNSPGIDNLDVLTIYEYENKKTIDINFIKKVIQVNPIMNNENNNDIYVPNSYTFFDSISQHKLDENLGVYKYCGKENVNGKKCIKISFTDNNEDNIHIDYYYIDLETNLIIKLESYSGKNKNELNLTHTITWEYIFNVVTDNDMVKFDINDYKDYEYYDDFTL